MRRFLVIVILSYFTAYYYLDSTYWANNNTNQFKNAVNDPKQKGDNQGVNQKLVQAYLISQNSTDLNLLSE